MLFRSTGRKSPGNSGNTMRSMPSGDGSVPAQERASYESTACRSAQDMEIREDRRPASADFRQHLDTSRIIRAVIFAGFQKMTTFAAG